MEKELIIVYTTYPDRDTAAAICRQLLEERLVACANLAPADSMYHWKGEIVRETEYTALFKTNPGMVQQLRARYVQLHPYEIPCFVAWVAQGDPAYADWVYDETGA